MSFLAKFRILCVLSCLLLFGCRSADKARKALAQEIAHAIPLQSTSAQVLSYLDGRKIVHSPYERDAMKGNSISAIVRYDPSEWAVVHTDYSIVYRFDGNDRLIVSEIHEIYTGP
jgi:hypothetical protein